MASNDEHWKALCEAGDEALRQKRLAEAEALYRQALPACERALGPDHATVANLLSRFGMALASQCKYDEAAPLLRRAAPGRSGRNRAGGRRFGPRL